MRALGLQWSWAFSVVCEVALRWTCGNLSFRNVTIVVSNRLNQKRHFTLNCNNSLPNDEEPAVQPDDSCHVEIGRSHYVTKPLNNLGPLYTRILRAFDPWYINYMICQKAGDGSSSLYTRPWWLEGPMNIQMDECFTWRHVFHRTNWMMLQGISEIALDPTTKMCGSNAS